MLERNWKRAVEDFDAALRINPNYENARVNREKAAARLK
jgi:lipoprotein NlpI